MTPTHVLPQLPSRPCLAWPDLQHHSWEHACSVGADLMLQIRLREPTELGISDLHKTNFAEVRTSVEKACAYVSKLCLNRGEIQMEMRRCLSERP